LTIPSCLKERRVSILKIKQKDIINTAEKQLGKSYCYGGKGPSCFDCSGFVHFVYGMNGITIPWTTEDLKKTGKKIRKFKNLKPADILIFKIRRRMYHAGIYIGNNEFIHSPKKGDRVRKEELNKYWRKKFKYGRRIL
jgi:cell wall-associated NlpC family hydrolase